MSNAITMHSKQLVVSAINKPTKARLLKDFRVGTRFKLYTTLTPTTGGSNGLYATYIKVVNLDTDESAKYSQNELLRVLPAFEYGSRVNE